MRNLFSLTLLLTASAAFAQAPSVTYTPAVTPVSIPAAPSVQLPGTPELNRKVNLTVPLGGLTLEQALTVIARAAGLNVLTQGLPTVTLRSGLSEMPAREAITTLINLYAPGAAATVKGRLLIVGDRQAVERVQGRTASGEETRVVRVPNLTAEQLARVIPFMTVRAALFEPGIVVLSGPSTALPGAERFLLSLPGLPAPNATPPLPVAATLSRKTYTSVAPEQDATYLRALYDDLKITPLPDQGLLVVEATALRHTDVTAALNDTQARRASRNTSYYPIAVGRATDLIPTLKRELPDAEINAVEGRNMLAVRTTSAGQVRLADLIRTLQGSPELTNTSDRDLITRSIKLGYSEAKELAGDLASLKLISATPAPSSTTPDAPTAAAASNSAINILADSRTNSLLITGPRAQVMEMVGAIAMIDVPARSVRVRLRVEQVNEADAQNLGVNWKVGILGVNASQQNGTLSVGYAPGLSPASIEVALNAAKTRGNSRTLIDSNFASLSGQNTSFQNGGELLFPSTTTGTGANATVIPGQTYSYGLEIKVRPRIAPDGTVVMTLDTNLGTTPTSGPMGSVQQSKQQLSTTVQIRPGETVVLGGIVTDTVDQSQRGVPGLSNLPVIGALFGTKTNSKSNTVLLFVVSAEELVPSRAAGAAPGAAAKSALLPNPRGTESVEIPAQGGP